MCGGWIEGTSLWWTLSVVGHKSLQLPDLFPIESLHTATHGSSIKDFWTICMPFSFVN